MVAFLAGPSHHTLESLEDMLGAGASSLDDALREVLDNLHPCLIQRGG